VKKEKKTATVPLLLMCLMGAPSGTLLGSARDARDVNRVEKVTPVTVSASLEALASSVGDANVLVVELTSTALLFVPLLNLMEIPWHLLVLSGRDVQLVMPRASVPVAGVALTVEISIIVTANAPCAAGA
jgi:hypothetical protein